MNNELLLAFNEELKNIYSNKDAEIIISELKSYLNTNDSSVNTDNKEPTKILRLYPSKYNTGDNNGLLTVLDNISNKDISVFNYISIPQPHPSSTDDMDAPIDFNDIDPFWGTWEDLKKLSTKAPIMIDCEIQHTSCESKWFKKYRAGVPEYSNFFIKEDKDNIPHDNLHMYNEFETMAENIMVLTTFALEKPDLNYANPNVFISICKLISNYSKHNIKAINIKNADKLWFNTATQEHNKDKSMKLINIIKRFNELSGANLHITTDFSPVYSKYDDINNAIADINDQKYIEIAK